MTVTATAPDLATMLEDALLEVERAVISNTTIILSSLVLLVVRLIIGGRVAVGGFARS